MTKKFKQKLRTLIFCGTPTPRLENLGLQLPNNPGLQLCAWSQSSDSHCVLKPRLWTLQLHTRVENKQQRAEQLPMHTS